MLHVVIKSYCGRCRRAGSKHARNRWRSPPHADGGPHVGRRWWMFTIRLGREGSVVAYHQNYATYERVTRAAARSYRALAADLESERIEP